MSNAKRSFPGVRAENVDRPELVLAEEEERILAVGRDELGEVSEPPPGALGQARRELEDDCRAVSPMVLRVS